MTFGEKLKKARHQCGLTQQQLAERVGMQRRAILQYENKRIYPRTRNTYIKLAQALGVDPAYLMSGEVPDAPSGRQTADRLVAEIRGLFAGGTLSEEDRTAVAKALQEACSIIAQKDDDINHKI